MDAEELESIQAKTELQMQKKPSQSHRHAWRDSTLANDSQLLQRKVSRHSWRDSTPVNELQLQKKTSRHSWRDMSPAYSRSRTRSRSNSCTNKKYSDFVKKYISFNKIESFEKFSKDHVTYLKRKFNKRAYQINRVAKKYFEKEKIKPVGRPEKFVKINKLMNDWGQSFMTQNKRPPTMIEIKRYGAKLKEDKKCLLSDELDWKCSKGWTKRFFEKYLNVANTKL